MTDEPLNPSPKQLLINFLQVKREELTALRDEEKDYQDSIKNLTQRYDPKDLTNPNEVGEEMSCTEKQRRNMTTNPKLISFIREEGKRPRVDWEHTITDIVYFEECIDCPGAGERPSEWFPCNNDRTVRDVKERLKKTRENIDRIREVMRVADIQISDVGNERPTRIVASKVGGL